MKGRRLLTAAVPGLVLATPALADGGLAVLAGTPLLVIGLFLVGLVFMLVEFFLLPGFGLAGVVGLLALGTHGFLLFTSHALGTALGILAVELVFSVGATVLAIRVLPHTALGKSMIQQTVLTARAPARAQLDPDLWIGKEGTAAGSIRPSGSVWIEDREFPARSRSGLIDEGTRIKVVGIDADVLVVKPVEG